MNKDAFDLKKIYLIEISQKLTATGAKTLDYFYLPKVNSIVSADDGKMELVHTTNKLFMLAMISSSKLSSVRKALTFAKEIKEVTFEIEDGDYQSKYIKEFDVEEFYRAYEAYYLRSVPVNYILDKIREKGKDSMTYMDFKILKKNKIEVD